MKEVRWSPAQSQKWGPPPHFKNHTNTYNKYLKNKSFYQMDIEE
jgi:hypothetical protein